MMGLTIATPVSVVLSAQAVAQVRAEDPTGGFGIRPGHADFLTALVPSVVIWRDADGRDRYCAVRGGVLTVTGGRQVTVATREAVPGDDLEALEREVVARFLAGEEDEADARTGARQLHLAAVRRMLSMLRPAGVAVPRPQGPAEDAP